MPQFSVIAPGFSTADAEYPRLVAGAGSLGLTFTDWQEKLVRVRFDGVCAFRWQEAESLLDGEPYDGACELLGSEWLSLHRQQGCVPEGSALHHYRFNFNAAGQFEVLCGSFGVEA